MASVPKLSRRRFLGCGAGLLAAGGVWSQTSPAAGDQANNRLRIAAIGVGNRGETNVLSVRDEQVVALCDVDERYLDERSERFPGAALYRDYREMFERERLDAVVISTPDHAHAHAALLAMRRGLHVYCEKPLATTIAETRRMAAAAARHRVITQTGNQHHATRGYRRAIQLLQSRVLGDVAEVHCWTDRPFWPQGKAERPPASAPPRHLAWDLWLNTAPERPYADGYHPMNWRGYWDFGTGATGDRGLHLIDPVYSGLKLTLPSQVTAESAGVNAETLPEWSIVRYEFPERGDQPPVRLTWYEGGKQPPAERTNIAQLPPNGSLLIGSRARMFIPEMGGLPRLLPNPGMDLPALPAEPENPLPSHFEDWLAACRQRRPASFDFAVGARLTETCLLGNLAVRTGTTIRWDAAAGRAVENPAVDALLDRKYRAGWELNL